MFFARISDEPQTSSMNNCQGLVHIATRIDVGSQRTFDRHAEHVVLVDDHTVTLYAAHHGTLSDNVTN